ncbi:DUF2813 domain-containing protein [Pasteurellaceae bacterium 20609_3]|nr:DUF2813 domain-containing protein [Spirabiliibacterium mucosae]
MYLKQVDISGFRGLNRLSISLRSNMVLVGENAWGKSSLLDALSLILNPASPRYQFQPTDFHFTPEEYAQLESAPQGLKKSCTLLLFSVSVMSTNRTLMSAPTSRRCFAPMRINTPAFICV